LTGCVVAYLAVKMKDAWLSGRLLLRPQRLAVAMLLVVLRLPGAIGGWYAYVRWAAVCEWLWRSALDRVVGMSCACSPNDCSYHGRCTGGSMDICECPDTWSDAPDCSRRTCWRLRKYGRAESARGRTTRRSCWFPLASRHVSDWAVVVGQPAAGRECARGRAVLERRVLRRHVRAVHLCGGVQWRGVPADDVSAAVLGAWNMHVDA
jgi:hypothetical protein